MVMSLGPGSTRLARSKSRIALSSSLNIAGRVREDPDIDGDLARVGAAGRRSLRVVLRRPNTSAQGGGTSEANLASPLEDKGDRCKGKEPCLPRDDRPPAGDLEWSVGIGVPCEEIVCWTVVEQEKR